jgi:NAD(P)-dependent dehydrogenase (short-subunit alcohol dehydrogenase family)
MKIQGSIALVTGASRGIGRSLVSALLAGGATKVYAAARDVSKIDARDPRVVPLQLDVTNGDDIAAAAKKAADVNLLINNAGVLASYDLLATPRSDIERDLATNFFGTLAVTRAFAPIIERSGGGAVANLLTVVSLASMPALGGYSAAKAAAFSLTQALRAQLRAKKIDVHAVFPGPIDTDMAKDITLPKTSPDVAARAIVEGIARGDEDILPDPMAQQVFAQWAKDPKSVERQFGSM